MDIPGGPEVRTQYFNWGTKFLQATWHGPPKIVGFLKNNILESNPLPSSMMDLTFSQIFLLWYCDKVLNMDEIIAFIVTQ